MKNFSEVRLSVTRDYPEAKNRGIGFEPYGNYYTRGLLSEEELHGGQFFPIMSGFGLMQAASMPVGKSRRKQGLRPDGIDDD